MVQIINNTFSPFYFGYLLRYVEMNKFQTVNVGGKDFTVLNPKEEIIRAFVERISRIEKRPIQLILGFFRLATKDIDTDWRIHSDLNINGQKPDKAGVFYFRENEDELSGTAFWKHKEYGSELPIDFKDEDYDRLLMKDANDLDKWTLTDVVSSVPNRLLLYKASQFHSKFPNVSWGKGQEDGRIVFVMFYNLK